MPVGYRGEGKTYSKKLGKWIKKETERAFDYENVNQESVAYLISFFRVYPDYFADLLRSEKADYKLELPQRLMMRLLARYRNVFITGVRGLSKTYTLILTKMICGVLYPNEIMRYTAPNQKQAAALAAQAYHQIEKDYPALCQMWQLRNDRTDMFRITTRYSSELTMYAPRGSNCSSTIAEEINAEGENGFDMETYEKDVLPTCRLIRKVNQVLDHTHINLQHAHITNASSKQNRGFTEHRYKALKDMLYGEKYEGYVVDISWITPLICNIRDINYIKDQKSKLTNEDWLREMCARYTGSGQNPLISDELLSRSRKLRVMEDRHCGDDNAYYVLSHDVAYESGQKNARCADTVVKYTRYSNPEKRDKYRKQVVYVSAYSPPATEALQSQKIKDLWLRFCKDGAQPTYIVVDARAVGKTVVQELMKPTHDGTPTLCCYNNMDYQDIAQPNALPVIYPLKASNGGVDNEGEMIRYARREFEVGNVELLIPNVLDGVNDYKTYHGIKDEYSDSKIILPYKQTEELCQEIQNLEAKVSGASIKEERKSKAIQRDIWSSLKYNLHFCSIALEDKLVKETYKAKSSWSEAIQNYNSGAYNVSTTNGTRANLLAMRKR